MFPVKLRANGRTDMANTPKKLQDPTEAALSAIQDALNLREENVESDPNGLEPRADAGAPVGSEPIDAAANRRRRTNKPIAAGDDDLLFAHSSAQADDEDAPRRRAANDDRQSMGQVLQGFQRRPPRSPFMAASLISLVWIVVGLGLASGYLGQVPLQGPFFGFRIFVLAALIGVPVLFFFVCAHLLWRTQELRFIARSMTEVALRLAEPETIARESIVSVGQAIRREVAAMGDGVERALARAAELEALVHTEVAALERAYNDNELRIRGLLERHPAQSAR